MLDLLKAINNPVGIPLLFRCLAHPAEEVRTVANRVVQTFRWEDVAAAVEDLARHGNVERVGFVLDGLAAFEAHRDLVALLDRLVTLLKGDAQPDDPAHGAQTAKSGISSESRSSSVSRTAHIKS